MRISPNTAAIDAETMEKKKVAHLWKASGKQGSLARYPCHLCQPLKDTWEGVYPGSTPSSHSGAFTQVYTSELLWVGTAFPPGAQSLVQAVTLHFHYKLNISFSFPVKQCEVHFLLKITAASEALSEVYSRPSVFHKSRRD